MKALRILVVEDDPQVGRSFAMLLRTLGVEAVVEPGSVGALARVAAEPFDLVITDLRMPGGSGVDLARALATQRPGLPVVLASGDEGAVDAATLASAGIVGVLPKPIMLGELKALLGRLFEPA